MKPLFLRLYLGILLCLVVVVVGSRLLTVRSAEGAVLANVERFARLGVAPLVDRVLAGRAAGQDTAAILALESARSGLDMKLVVAGEIPLDQAAAGRLERGEVVAARAPRSLAVLAAVGHTGEVLEIALVTPPRPLNGFVLGVIVLAMVPLYLQLRPLEKRLSLLARAARDFGLGDRATRVAPGPDDGLGQVCLSFNAMADRVSRSITDQRELFRLVSHELKTPLQRLQFSLELARKSAAEPATLARIDAMNTSVDQLGALVDELLLYASLDGEEGGPRVPTDLRALLAEAVATVAPEGPAERAIKVSLEAPEPLVIEAPARMLKRALSNLMTNAVQHARARVVVSLSRAEGGAQIVVEDDGSAPEVGLEDHLFGPFQRADGAIHGSSLLLAIVRRAAELDGGRLELGPSVLGGACFRLILPLSAPKCAAGRASFGDTDSTL